MHRRSLRIRLVLLVLIPSIPLLAITAYVANELRNRDIASARAELAAFASRAAADLQDSTQETRHLLEAIARIPAVAGPDPVECTRIFGAIVESAPRLGVILRTDAEGRGLCHSAGMDRLASYGEEAYFAHLRRSGHFLAGEPVIGRVTGRPLFITGLVMRGDSGEFLGALLSGLDLRWFGDNLVLRQPQPNLSLTLWAPDGAILYRFPDTDAFIGRKAEASGIGAAVRARTMSEGFIEAPDVHGKPALYAVRGIEDWSTSRMTITVGASSADLVAGADAIFRRSMISFGVIFAIALGTALLMGEYGIRRRTLAVTEASARIAAGDLAARTGVAPSRDELGQLAKSFDSMAGVLESTSVSLRMLSEAGKSLVRATDEVSLLQDICRIVVDHGGYLSCYAGRAEHDEARTLRAMGGRGYAPGYLESLVLTWDERDMGRGPSGIAIRTGVPTAIRDLGAEDVDSLWGERMRARGYGSFVALPIRTGGEIYGVLGVASRVPGRFAEAEVARLMELADDLGFGIEALRNRQALDRHAHELEDLVAERTGQLQSANRFLDSVIENIPDMVFVKRASDLRFVRFNRAGEELLGTSREDILGKNDHDLFPESQADFFVRRDREVLAGTGMVEIPEEPVQTAHGTRLLNTKKIPIVDEEGRPAYLLGISRDITTRLENERQILALNATLAKRAAELDAANHELEAFSYSVSHDLRAPLRHVQGYVELLTNAAGGNLSDKARRYLSVINDSAREMGALIDDLLMFSRTARTEMRLLPVDLGPLVAESVKALEMQTEGRRIEWRIGELPRVLGDPTLLRQVWANLLGNAVKYTRGRDPAVIEVDALREPGAPPVVRVRDNGVGFDMKHAAKLFGVFQRLHRADEFEGTGIGLAIVQRVLSRHGGRIWAEAEPDRGATFSFTLQAGDDGGSQTAPEVS